MVLPADFGASLLAASSSEMSPFLPMTDVDSMDVDDPSAFGMLDPHDAPTEEVDINFFNDFPDDFEDEDLN
jgi:hypothetical protein